MYEQQEEKQSQQIVKLESLRQQLNKQVASMQAQVQFTQNQSKRVEDKISDVLKFSEVIQSGVRQVKEEVKQSSRKTELAQLRKDLQQNYTKLSDYDELRNQVEQTVKRTQFQKIALQTKEMYVVVPTLANKIALQNEVTKLQRLIQQTAAPLMLKNSAERSFDMINMRADVIQASIAKLEQRVTQIEEKIQGITSTLAYKAQKTQILELKNDMQRLATKQQFAEFKQFLLNGFRDNSQKIAQFQIQNEKNKEIIRRFDQVLLAKASKFSLDKQISQVKETYTTLDDSNKREQNANSKFNQINKQIQGTKQMINMLSKSVSKDIFQAVRRATNQLVQNQKNQLNSTEIKQLLSKKADKSDLNSINQIKSNKIDLEQTMHSVEVIYKQLQHLIVILVQLMRNNMNKANDTKNSIENKHIFLLKQAINICQWISKFDTGAMVSQKVAVPRDLQTYHSYVKQFFSDFAKQTNQLNPPKVQLAKDATQPANEQDIGGKRLQTEVSNFASSGGGSKILNTYRKLSIGKNSERQLHDVKSHAGGGSGLKQRNQFSVNTNLMDIYPYNQSP